MAVRIVHVIGRVSSALVLVLAVALARPVALFAQQPSVASAVVKWASRPLAAGADSDKVLLRLKIVGLDEDQLRKLKGQIVVVDGNNRSYPLRGIILGRRDTTRSILFGSYWQPTTERAAEREFMFLVPRGQTAFELQLPSHRPVPFKAVISLKRT